MILTFKPQFVEPIKNGTKIHTIREDKKGRWKPGTKIHFWNGNPRNVKAKPHQFQSGICTDVESITLDFKNDNVFFVGGIAIIKDIDKLDKFAKNDGFENWNLMKDWFFENYEGKKIFFRMRLIHFKVYATI